MITNLLVVVYPSNSTPIYMKLPAEETLHGYRICNLKHPAPITPSFSVKANHFTPIPSKNSQPQARLHS